MSASLGVGGCEGSSRVTLRGVASKLGNLILASLFASFAWIHIQSFLDLLRLSALLIVFKELLDAAFYLTRRRAESYSISTYEWAAGLGGTFLPLLLRPNSAAHDLWLGDLLLCTGLALQSLGMLSLKRSIGIVPANRGIQTSGLYRIVRHPLYTAYTLTFAGYLLNHPTLHNALLLAMWQLVQVLRILNEERFLRQEPAYARFMKLTRWRLIPAVF